MINKEKLYPLEEALELVLATQRAKFTETLDLSVKLGIDPTKPEQNLKSFVDLPHGVGRTRKVLAIVSDKNKEEAEKAGADYAGEEYIEKINGGWVDFDVVVATPDMMPKIGKIGKKLGTKGLMPNVKYGTISKDIASAVKGFKESRVVLKNDKYALLNLPVGKSNFSKENLLENIKHFFKELLKLKPATSRGQFVRSMSMSLTMGPSAKVDVPQLLKDLRS